jgi:hypothetical protein
VFERAVELPPGASLGQLARGGALQSSDLARLGLADAAALSTTLDSIASLPDHASNKTFKAFQAVLPDVATAYELLNEAPATHQEITAQITKLQDVEVRLATHENRFGTKDFGDEAINDCGARSPRTWGPCGRA